MARNVFRTHVPFILSILPNNVYRTIHGRIQRVQLFRGINEVLRRKEINIKKRGKKQPFLPNITGHFQRNELRIPIPLLSLSLYSNAEPSQRTALSSPEEPLHDGITCTSMLVKQRSKDWINHTSARTP